MEHKGTVRLETARLVLRRFTMEGRYDQINYAILRKEWAKPGVM